MKGKLPQVYVNMITKQLNNNEKIFYSGVQLKKEDSPSSNETITKITETDNNIDISKKIEDMFNSPNYVYKLGVYISTKDGSRVKKDIIGKIDEKLITLDEEYIPIEEIKDIEY